MLKSGPKLVNCQEDDEFQAQLDRIMNEVTNTLCLVCSWSGYKAAQWLEKILKRYLIAIVQDSLTLQYLMYLLAACAVKLNNLWL